MNHKDVEKSFLDFLEGALPEAKRCAVEEHLAACEQCKSAFEKYQELIELEKLIAGESHQLGAEFSVQVMDSLSKVNTKWSRSFDILVKVFRRQVLIPGATVAAACFALFLAYRQPVTNIVRDAARVLDRPEKAESQHLQIIKSKQPESSMVVVEPVERRGVEKSKAPSVIPTATLEDLLPPGHRAVTVQVDTRTGVEGWATPGAHTDMLVTYDDPEDKGRKTRVAVEDAVVLSYQGKAPKGADSSGKSTVTLAVPSGDSLKASTASALGDISLVLRRTDDPTTTGSAVFEGSQFGKPERVTKNMPDYISSGYISTRDASGNKMTFELGKDNRWWKEGTVTEDIASVTASRKSKKTELARAPEAVSALSSTAPRKAIAPAPDERKKDRFFNNRTNRRVDFNGIGNISGHAGKQEAFVEPSTHGSIIAPPPQPPRDYYIPPRQSGEVYGNYEENQRTLVAEKPLSTFSIDVDSGSYSNMRRFLSMGKFPPTNSVRIEEFINYFDYQYPSQSTKPFTVHYEAAPSPLAPERYLLKIGIKAKEATAGEKSWNLVFLADVSGSMSSQDKLPLLKRALKVLVNNMRSEDRLAIVTYSNRAQVHLPSTGVQEKERIFSAIEALHAGGGTNGSGGIDLAYRMAQDSFQKGGVNRVILATDGDFNVGTYSFNGLMNLIEEKRRSGVSLTSLGFGTGNIKEKNMEQLADKGNGNYFYIDSFKEARRVLGSKLASNVETVAKDVKLQVEFNPEQVLEYRLIGYDNRKLQTQDFNNDAVDAGEIGSGHTVTALYEIVLAGTDMAERLQTSLRYQQEAKKSTSVPKSLKGELAFVKIRYKEPRERTSKLLEYPVLREKITHAWQETSKDFRFAAAVSYFGHMLRQSQFTGSYSFQDIASLAKNSLSEDPQGIKREFVELIENAQAAN